MDSRTATQLERRGLQASFNTRAVGDAVADAEHPEGRTDKPERHAEASHVLVCDLVDAGGKVVASGHGADSDQALSEAMGKL